MGGGQISTGLPCPPISVPLETYQRAGADRVARSTISARLKSSNRPVPAIPSMRRARRWKFDDCSAAFPRSLESIGENVIVDDGAGCRAAGDQGLILRAEQHRDRV